MELFNKVGSSVYYNQMQRTIAPLRDCLGIKHFWHYRVTYEGHYLFLGSHLPWTEFCFQESLTKHFPLRHPDAIDPGVQLMKVSASDDLKKVFDIAWDKFQISFSLNLLQKTPEGIESFGFATSFKDPRADEKLLNELPLLRHFTDYFRQANRQLLNQLKDVQVDLKKEFGSLFFEQEKSLICPFDREQFLQKTNLGAALKLSGQQKKVLKFLTKGYSAPVIAKQLDLSPRTIESYLAYLKKKLFCQDKLALIEKAQEINAIGYLDEK